MQCMLNKRRKRVVLKNCCEVFRDKSHQSLYQNIKVYNDIESNPGPVYVNELCTVAGSLHQGNEELFEINSEKRCVVNSLVTIIFNAIASCFTETWNSTKMDNILRVGNSLMAPASTHIGRYRNVRGLGKSMVVFRLFEKLRYSNERSTVF